MTALAENVRLAGAPAGYGMPETRPSLAEARAWCRHLATTHYENFHVATWFLPRQIRPYFESIYAFSRVADDLGDEVADTATATRLLAEWRELLRECYEAPVGSLRVTHPVFVALRATIEETGVPRCLFDDLITAFEMDQRVLKHDSVESLIAYSHYSANPVGRLVLWVSGYRDEERAQLSDKVCTALQLANFWQDVIEDWERGRRYLPADQMAKFGVTDEQIAERRFTREFRRLMASLVDDTLKMMREGGRVSALVDPELSVTLRLFEQGGRAALEGIVRQDYDVLRARPQVSKSTKVKLLAGALAGKAWGSMAPKQAAGKDRRG